jgi:hypothetical protein
VFGSSLALARSREAATQICRIVYEGICRFRFGYEIEPYSLVSGVQIIRTPAQIETHRTANCLDLACMFASILVAANQAPVLIVIDGPGFAHALIGVRMPGEPNWVAPSLGDLRRAVALGDAIFFEPTGAAETSVPAAAETELERRDKILDFSNARAAAARMIDRTDIQVRHAIDVRALRQT